MRTLLVLLVLIGGCGTNIGDPLAGTTTFADARTACIPWLASSDFGAVVDFAQAARGACCLNKFTFIAEATDGCRSRCEEEADPSKVGDCTSALSVRSSAKGFDLTVPF